MPVLDFIPKKKRKAPKAAGTPPILVPQYQPELQPSQHPVPPRLAEKLLALGRRHRAVNVTERIARYGSVALILLAVQMFLDWLVILNVFERALILAGEIALLDHLFRRQVLPLIQHAPSMDACALMVEKHWPSLHGRLIATIQFARPRFTRDSPDSSAPSSRTPTSAPPR